MRELLSKLKAADPVLLAVAGTFGVIGIFALVFPSVSIHAQRKRWFTDTVFLGNEAAFFALISITLAYAVGRLAFRQDWKVVWKVELPILSAIYFVAFVLYQIGSAIQ